jgi:hypothetical protein
MRREHRWSFNRLERDELAGSDVILKYHYVPGLAASTSVRLEPVMILGDPTRFIRILDPTVASRERMR